MICRGGIVVGGWGDVPAAEALAVRARPHPIATLSEPQARVRWSRLLLSVIALALAIALLPGRGSIPPLIESDYCYLLIAAERFYNGLGLTSLQPVAPLQPWEWRYDWGFLTQWPTGYPILVAGLRAVLRCSSLEACRMISIIGCAASLVGWFTFIRRSLPPGVTGHLLAGAAATSCLSVGLAINPSTDLILMAALPFIMLLTCESLENRHKTSRRLGGLALVGLLSGGLFWFRYASIFVPAAIGLFLFIEFYRRRVSLAGLATFAIAGALPIGVLVAINSTFGAAAHTTEQFNLGTSIGFDVSLSAPGRAWWMFSDLGFYSHRPLAHWLFALVPLAIPLALFFQPARLGLARLLERSEIRVALLMSLSLMGMLVTAAAIFGEKFDYIGLERYYLPVRPLYFLIFAASVILIPRRAVRTILCLILLSFGSWTLFQDWIPTYSRWIHAARPSTPWGAWSRPFEPKARELYAWLRSQNDNASLLVFSNFHEYLSLESGMATLPIPPTIEALQKVCADARKIRGVEPRPLFVLNPENWWRDYWIAPPAEVIRDFDLRPDEHAPPELRPFVLIPAIKPLTAADYSTLISWN